MAPSSLSAPFARFETLLSQAQHADSENYNAFVLATSDENQRPHARVLLLKGFDEAGFVFFTNTLSPKGKHLAHHPYAAMCFWWPTLLHQVRIEGQVSGVSSEEADAYFATRPRLSQEGAWASLQSQPLLSRQTLLLRLAEIQSCYGDKPIPRPPYWSGYRLAPQRFEFWKACPGRLHERQCFEKEGGKWEEGLLYP
ncbi:MAG: pyridoxamine 5'-phosphate oxidase [Cystobacterineae bacterium]|nr:pyridoxamine 5'-phosphate oxidase [Cystobacterineae bacterium]